MGLNLKTCDLYQDNLNASKVIKRLTKTKQTSNTLLSEINIAQPYHGDKLFETIQTPTEEMITDSLTETTYYNYATAQMGRLGVNKMPNYWAQEGVLVIFYMIWSAIAVYRYIAII